jgi:predicted component of type VI protein secretion system|tara:strand:+ start:6168 stop:6530 length:363 start_codon:yes stop_codon:yes gene_type:complete
MNDLTTIYQQVGKLCNAHLDELQERIEKAHDKKPTKTSLRRVLLSLGSGSLSALFNTRESAQQLGRSEAWVKQTAREHGIGRIRRTAGSGQLEFTLDDLDELKKHVKNTRRGRPTINKYR